jgi:hypothetical protein
VIIVPTIHDKACDMIVQYEIKQGRNAVNVANKHLHFDIQGTRNIEVKATTHSKIPSILYFYQPSWDWFRKDPNAWLYIVYDMKKKPRLLKMSRDDILKSCGINTYVEIWVTLPKEFRKAIKNIGAEIEL